MEKSSSARNRLNKALGLFVSVPMFAMPAVAQQLSDRRLAISGLRTGVRALRERARVRDTRSVGQYGIRLGRIGYRIGEISSCFDLKTCTGVIIKDDEPN
jgi:hypothetical protein